MTQNSNEFTGLIIKLTEFHDDDAAPYITTGYKITCINVNHKKNPIESWTPIFEYNSDNTYGIAMHFLIKFQNPNNNYINSSYFSIKSIIRYGTHEYDVVNVLAKNHDGNKLRLYGEKLGEITYDITHTDNQLVDFIRPDDRLLIKFPSQTGKYVQIIDNISYQQRKFDFHTQDCWRGAWANDDYLPIKYRFSPTGELLQNKRIKSGFER